MSLHQAADLAVPCQSGTHSLMLVESNGHAIPSSAEGDSKVNLSLFHGLGQRMGVVRIVATYFGIGSEIHNLISLFL